MKLFQTIILLTAITVFSCEKKVVVEVPVEGSTTSKKVEVEVSTDIPKVNRDLKKLKTDLQNTMDKRESGINKKLPSGN